MSNHIKHLIAERSKHYGNPQENHARTARLWNAYLASRANAPLTPEDICFLNILQKVARCLGESEPTKDTLLDIAGYARNIEMILGYDD